MKKLRGFTLVELLVVIIVVAVLASIAIPKFQNSTQRAREAALKSQLQHIREAVEKFYNDCDGWPVTLADLAAPTAPAKCLNPAGNQKTLSAGKYRGPYLVIVPQSPILGGSFVYVNSKTGLKNVGDLSHTAGVALDGTNFANW